MLFFPTSDSFRRAWDIIEATTRADLLGTGSKCKDNGSAGGTILVYTPEDKETMLAIALRLTCLLKLEKNIFWKSDEQTARGEQGSKYFFDMRSQTIQDR